MHVLFTPGFPIHLLALGVGNKCSELLSFNLLYSWSRLECPNHFGKVHIENVFRFRHEMGKIADTLCDINNVYSKNVGSQNVFNS